MKFEDLTTDMQRFLNKGGHFSMRTKKFKIEG